MKVSVPGVNKILGTFATCCKGPALCIPDERGLEADLTLRSDNIVKAVLVKSGECKKYQLGSNKIKKEDKWFNAVKGVVIALSKVIPVSTGFDICFNGSVLECEGHIVYSAIAVTTAKALTESMKMKMSVDELANLADSALHIISEGGNMSDILTMLINEKNRFLVYDGATRRYAVLENPFTGSEYSMIIFDGHVPTSSLKEEANYYEKTIADTWKKIYDNFGFRFHFIDESELRERAELFSCDEMHIARFIHEEHKAAANIEKTIENRDIRLFGKTLEKIQNNSVENLEMVCPEMDWVIKRAYENNNCIGACTFYEGYVTKVAMIVKNSGIDKLRSYKEEYEHIFGFDITSQYVGDYF